MVKRNFDMNQVKLGIKTLDWNVPENHISRFVVEFVEEVFPLLNTNPYHKDHFEYYYELDALAYNLIRLHNINKK